MNELLKFSHDRSMPFNRNSCDSVKDAIDAFADQPGMKGFYDHFEKSYSIPVDVVRMQVKQRLERTYDYIKAQFPENLERTYSGMRWQFPESFYPGRILQMFVRHIGFLAYAFLRARKYDKTDRYKLIVEVMDKSDNRGEVSRFSKLIDLFGKDASLIVAMKPVEESGYNTTYRPVCKFYDRAEVIHSILRELLRGLWGYIGLSLKLKFNIFPLASHVLNQYLYYESIFKYNRADYCIQERHYQTSAVKNYVFRKYGGRFSTSIQKNMPKYGSAGLYHDMDVFFTLGKRTAGKVFECGARIGQVVPVGSLFMERYWFSGEKDREALEKEYDIVYVGVNYYKEISQINAYDSFTDDYYETFKWLVGFARENPHLRIGIIHHPSFRGDQIEEEIVEDSPVEIIDHRLNSYEIAFRAKCAVTFCSTMGYELIAHGIETLFLDPGRRDVEILPDDELIDDWRVISYEDLRGKLTRLLSGEKLGASTEAEDLCLYSGEVSERIRSWMLDNGETDRND
jgi:hypothetical protein